MMTTFDALADPMRRRILDLLRERPRLVGELADLLSISQPGISKHLRVLREVGLVRVRKAAQRRWYELRPEPLAEVHAWLESYRHFWDERFQRLDDYLQELQENEKKLENTMRTVISKDGTALAFDQSGQGPALILVAGATATRLAEAALSAHLAPHFTVLAYDRRGRGDSGDTPPYAVEREVEDLEALITEAGGSAFVFGHSSGAVLALEAARLLPGKIKKLAMYEPPFIIDDSRPPVPQDYVPHLNELIAAGRRGEAVEYFMTDAMLVPAEMVAQMRNSPMWPQIEAVAHTIPYDGTIMGDTMSGNPSTIRKWASVTVPTLVMVGGASHAFFHNGTQTLVDILPNAQYRRLPGQDHGPADEVLTPALVEFFKG
jgi:pimeloyl-ACP methyl ester carboxylesterase/DNA-binding transcriptional ArsR family regulator